MWTALPMIGFDTETTGIRPEQDRLVTCSLVTVSNEGVSKRYWLADPGVPIPEQASAVHGITTEKAQAEGRPITEVLQEISDVLVAHMQAGNPVVAFNAQYDFTLLEAELRRHGLATMSQRLGSWPRPVVDPYLLDRSVDRYRKGKRRLEDLCAFYKVEGGDFHNAEADVLATLRLLGAMLRAHRELAGESLERIQERAAQANADMVEFFNRKDAAAGRPVTPAPQHWPVADGALVLS
ncbi:DNA polymerase III subunit epsilon [Arcanobacterium haemolyticum]|nr:DNA polymerase III subunit epsilon [Arcanobacterium haemolyticum]